MDSLGAPVPLAAVSSAQTTKRAVPLVASAGASESRGSAGRIALSLLRFSGVDHVTPSSSEVLYQTSMPPGTIGSLADQTTCRVSSSRRTRSRWELNSVDLARARAAQVLALAGMDDMTDRPEVAPD